LQIILKSKKKNDNVSTTGQGDGLAVPIRLAWRWPNYPQAKRAGRPPPMGWLGHPNIYFFLFLKNKIKCDGGILGIKKKKVKVVKLSQFESLEELSIIFETFEIKVKMDE
jgi:hypothetical protein